MMRKSIFVLCAVLLAAFATGAGAEEIYLPGGVSALTVGIEAALTLPSTISLTEVSWVIDDETILELINSNNTSCTVKPLKEGSTIVKAVGKDSSGTPKQVGPTIVKVVAAGSDDANSDETDGNSDSDSSGDSSGSGSTDSQPLGTRAQLTVGTPVRFFIPTTASFTSAEWSFEPQSRVGEPVYADNKHGDASELRPPDRHRDADGHLWEEEHDKAALRCPFHRRRYRRHHRHHRGSERVGQRDEDPQAEGQPEAE